MFYLCNILQATHPSVSPPVVRTPARHVESAILSVQVSCRKRKRDTAIVDGEDSCHLCQSGLQQTRKRQSTACLSGKQYHRRQQAAWRAQMSARRLTRMQNRRE